MALFHYRLGMPETVKAFGQGIAYLAPTSHCRYVASERGITLPDFVELEKTLLVEADVEGATVTKVLVRQPYDMTRDLCMVLAPSAHTVTPWTLITVWLNHTRDDHPTLDTSRYARPEAV